MKSQTSIRRALGLAIATLAFSQFTIAQADPAQLVMPDVAGQLGKFSGTLHAIASACGHYSNEQLAEMKEQQRKQLQDSGMDISGFDKTFASSEREMAEKWKAMSEAEQSETCEKVKQQMSTAPTG
ncbi:hypothetical protein [Microbulbifer taiwanensis]|uniref:DUF4168 domain-containing protein n=1 Tax=Microbulbifer taiwanensis TaxID=986746 RepID=A0ABW1YS13_9GAMM|nr:hypothetical protein [Microbulbifer taiwanensis]